MKRGTLDAWLQRKTQTKTQALSSPGSQGEPQGEVSTPSTASAASPMEEGGRPQEVEPLPPALTSDSQASSLLPEKPISTVLSFVMVDRPRADYRGIPNESLGDLLYIADFVWTFRSLLRVKEVAVPELRTGLQALEPSEAVVGVVRALVRQIAADLIEKAAEEDMADGLQRVRLAGKLKTQMDIDVVCRNAFLPLAHELLNWSLRQTDCEWTSDLLDRLQFVSTRPDFFSALDYSDRTAVLVHLCDLATECTSVHDVLGERMDEKKSLGHKKAELTSQLRAFNKQHKGQQLVKSSAEGQQKATLKAEIAKIASAIRAIPLRTEPLGYDRGENCYYRFGFDPTRVFVQRKQAEDASGEFWFCYQSRDLQRKLTRALNAKYECEGRLREALEKVVAEDWSEGAEMQVEEEESPVPGREEVVKRMRLLEERVSSFFESALKSWETPDQVANWRAQVMSEVSLEDLKLLLLDFAKKANSPLKQCANAVGMSRKGTIRLWNDYGEALQDWLDVWTACSSFPDLWFLISSLEAVFNNYFHKKRSGVLSQKELEQSSCVA